MSCLSLVNQSTMADDIKERSLWTGSENWGPDPPGVHQCRGSNRLGERCKRRPIPGGFVCVLHGGAAPLVKAQAKKRLLAMVEPAFQVLLDAMQSQDENVAVRAAKIVLDRAGFGPQSKVVVQDDREDLSRLSKTELAERARRIAEELQADAEDVIDRHVENAVH
jgi:hypothetical protein